MKILVAVASKHGSTREIADAIGDELSQAGHTVEVWDIAEAPQPQKYDIAVIGSSVYAGNWLKAAKRFVEEHQAALLGMPVWLFSSGPLGEEEPQPVDDPSTLEILMAQTGALGHQVFVGSLREEELGLGEKLVVKMVKAPYGDFRDWAVIRTWAQEIANAASRL